MVTIKVTVTKVIGDDWIEQADEGFNSDEYLKELINEDPIAFLEDANFVFDRGHE